MILDQVALFFWLMTPFLKVFAFFYSNWVRQVEKKIGYRIQFKRIPETWVNGVLAFDIERSWRKHGIEAWGVDYWTIGSLMEGVSSRFLRSQNQYQSWLGAYLVKFKNSKSFTLQDHLDLAVADQKNWLRDFGDPHPFIRMPAENVAEPEDITLSGHSGKLYTFLGGQSHSDVGNRSDNLRSRILMALSAALFNRYNSRLNLKGVNLIPKEIHSEYETVTLKGYVAIIELEENTKAVLYGNGTTIHNSDGTETDYSLLMKDEILAAFRAVEISKL